MTSQEIQQNKTYIIIKPYQSITDGIATYTSNIALLLEEMNVNFELLINEKNLDPNQWAQHVNTYLSKKYGKDEIIIESPEARASTLLLDRGWNVHIRLHCPIWVAQKYDNFPNPNIDRFNCELRVIEKAKYVSIPTTALIDELKSEIDLSSANIFRNPIFYNARKIFLKEEKIYDIIFFSRFQTLKGMEFLNPILEGLPAYYKVAFVGRGATAFQVSPKVKCKIIFKAEHIQGDERFEHLGKAKVSLILSKFENHSMATLESFSCGTKIVSWNLKSVIESCNNKVAKIVPFGDIYKMISSIRYVCENEFLTSKYPSKKDFLSAIKDNNDNFKQGFIKMLNHFGIKVSNLPQESSNVTKQNVMDNEDEYFNVNRFNGDLNSYSGHRVLAMSLYSLHLEEMWMPIIKRFELDFKFICPKELGYAYKFHNPYPVDLSKVIKYDFTKDLNRLILNIHDLKPNQIWIFGRTDEYKVVIQKIKTACNIPIKYTELGWLPQKNHIFFDEEGCGGDSRLAKLNLEELTGKAGFKKISKPAKIKGDYILIVTQLEFDAQIVYDSKRFKKMLNFAQHIISTFPNENIIIKCHPLDRDYKRFNALRSDKVQISSIDSNLKDLLMKAKAVCGINSTSLIEALEFDLNIYQFGESILNNKDVVIDCRERNLKDMWTEKLYSTREKKDAVLKALKERQINVRDVFDLSDKEIFESSAFRPILTNVQSSPNIISQIPPLVIPTKVAPTATVKTIKNMSSFRRKLNKLKANPYKFFADSKNSLVRSLKIFYKKK